MFKKFPIFNLSALLKKTLGDQKEVAKKNSNHHSKDNLNKSANSTHSNKMLRKEIYVALAGKSHKNSNNLNSKLVSGLDISHVGFITFFEPPPGSDEKNEHFKNAYKATFTYFEKYLGPMLDPINLNYSAGQREFSIPQSLKREGIFRVFSDCLPSGSGRQRLHKEFPETKSFSELKLLSWLAEGGGKKEKISELGFASGAMLFFTKHPGDENNHTSLEDVGEFRAKCVADLAGLAVRMSDKDISSSWIHGGAQVKTTYCDESGEIGPVGMHYIVKFNDLTSTNNARIEHASLELAKLAGIRTAKSIVVRVTSSGKFVADLFLIERYDRFTDGSGNDNRRHRLSLLSLMDPSKVARQDAGDYIDIFNAIRRVSANPDADCQEMFRRLLFNIGINNTDDHLKNHEFVHDQETNDWRLSQAYDINPNIYTYPHATSLAGYSNGVLSKEFIEEISSKLGLERSHALASLEKVMEAISKWKEVFTVAGCNSDDLNYVSIAINNHGKMAQQLYGFNKDHLLISTNKDSFSKHISR